MLNDPPHNDSSRPTQEQLLAYIHAHPSSNGRRDIAKHFRLKGDDRRWLREILKQMSDDGLIERQAKRVRKQDALPSIMLLDVLPNGDRAQPAEEKWRGQDLIFILEPNRVLGALSEQDRVLAKIRQHPDGQHSAKAFRKIPKPRTKTIVGRYERGVLESANRRDHAAYHVSIDDIGAFNLNDGDLLQAETRDEKAFGLTLVKVLRIIATAQNAQNIRCISLVSAAEHNVPLEFSKEAIAEADILGPPDETGRKDLRSIPLVTIDGRDARDFDDAIWAEPWTNTATGEQQGHRILVAIADVASYVTVGSALDREAHKRGNSTYFPDRVLPMLPEALSNGWCSLVPGEDRGCLAVDMRIDLQGTLKHYTFIRGIMCSHARLIYEDVEAAIKGEKTSVSNAIWTSTIKPAYEAYQILRKARETRGALNIDVPEQVVVLSKDHSHVESVTPRQRLEAHQLIEEFMVLANVAAATGLEAINQGCLYRLHDQPDPIKLDTLKQLLKGTPAEISGKKPLAPHTLNSILGKLKDQDYAPMIHEAVLRSQMQAYYGPTNIGHFGLSLAKYAHFTSPIRRYADLCVHRALIHGFRLGTDGKALDNHGEAKRIGEQISWTERQSVLAERAANDRYLAAYMQEHTGNILDATVSGVATFGVFFRLSHGHANAFMPMSLLSKDRYRLDQTGTALIGERWGQVINIGLHASVKVLEVDPLSGGITVQAEKWEQEGGLPFTPTVDKKSFARSRRSQKTRKASLKAKKQEKRRKSR